jgi:hypothetical protein
VLKRTPNSWAASDKVVSRPTTNGGVGMDNRGVAYVEPGKVELQPIDFPVLALGGRRCDHGVILKVVSTNICGSDQHMVRGRTTAPAGSSSATRSPER